MCGMARHIPRVRCLGRFIAHHSYLSTAGLAEHNRNMIWFRHRYQVRPDGIEQIELLMLETSPSPSDRWTLWAAQFANGSFVVHYKWFNASGRFNSPTNPSLGMKRTYRTSYMLPVNPHGCEHCTDGTSPESSWSATRNVHVNGRFLGQ